MNISSVLFICGVFLTTLSGVMAIPSLIEFIISGTFSLGDYIIPICITCFIGLSLFFSNKSKEKIHLTTSDGFLLTTLLWLIVPFFAGLPFYFNDQLKLSFVDAWLEATSALTATGVTVFSDPGILSNGINFWRFILCYIGGAGMILMGMIILPILRVGGMSLFRSESSEKSEKIMPRVSQMASRIALVYTSAIFVCFALLKITGLSTIDSLFHSISAIATCGLSTKAGSITDFKNIYSEIVLIIGMVFGGSSLLLYIKMWKDGFKAFKEDHQFRGYIKVLLSCSIIISILFWGKNNLSIFESIRYGFFNTVSLVTTTGFSNYNFNSLGNFSIVFFILISFIGGCTGSTSGGIKIFRLQVIMSSIKVNIMQLRRPLGVFVPMYKNQKITDSILLSVYVFIALYFFTIALITFSLSMFDIDFLSALSAAVASVGNVGAGVGNIVGFDATLSSVSIYPKMIMIFGMIFGRLEMLTILTILTPSFWRK